MGGWVRGCYFVWMGDQFQETSGVFMKVLETIQGHI